MRKKEIPRCAASMGCLCAGHARGNPASAACDTSEQFDDERRPERETVLIDGRRTRPRVCFKLTSIISQWPIVLYQHGADDFTVRYGLQLDAHLSYGRAAAKLGQAIMHALACEDKLNNEEAS